MKTSTKVLIGIGATAAIGTSVAVIVSDKIIHSLKSVKQRYTIKQFVNDKLNGNEKVLNVVNQLSDDEVESVVKILDRINESKNKISVTGNTVREATDELKVFLANLVEDII